MANGSRHSMRYIAESTYGTTPATPAFKPIRHTSTTLGLSKESLQSEEIRDDRQIADFRHGAYQVGGDMNIELSFASFDDLLEAVLLTTAALLLPMAGGSDFKRGTQLVFLVRFEKITKRMCLASPRHSGRIGARREIDHGHTGPGCKLTGGFNAVELAGQMHVHQNNVRAKIVRELKRLLA